MVLYGIIDVMIFRDRNYMMFCGVLSNSGEFSAIMKTQYGIAMCEGVVYDDVAASDSVSMRPRRYSSRR
jgi:hypothetical protein